MAKVKGNKAAFNSIRDRLSSAINSDEFLQKAGEVLVDQSQKSAYSGRNPTTGQKYPALNSEKRYRLNGKMVDYATYRKALSKKNRTSKFYTRNKAMTFTGQLIKSIGYKISKNRLTVSIMLIIDKKKDKRKPYKGINGRVRSSSSTNTDVEKGNRERGRPVIGISQETRDVITTQFKALLRRKLR